MSLYCLRGVRHSYDEAKTGRRIEAVCLETLTVEAGEILGVVGPNASGKSTLLELMAFLQPPTAGRIEFDGVDVWAKDGALAARRQAPMLLQKSLLFTTSALHNVTYGLRVRGVARAEAVRRAEAALELAGMRSLAHRRHNELSGGEQRRLALARILALDSRVILLDEPTASVDRDNERLIEAVIRTVNRERGVTVILASHNLRQAVDLSTRIVCLDRGRLAPQNLEAMLREFEGLRRRVPMP